MKIGNRTLSLSPFLEKGHYRAFFNIFVLCKSPFDFLSRYLFGKGKYPCAVSIRTPIGIVSPTAYSFFDIVTINVIFFRLDYRASEDIRVAADIGANIGISALYFLTRNRASRCYLYEPVPRNVSRLKANLAHFAGRIALAESAVYTDSLSKDFGVEDSGVFGGIHRKTDKSIQVSCIDINEVLKGLLAKHEEIDILKIDIEGDELDVVRSIKERFLDRIRTIYFETDDVMTPKRDMRISPRYFKERKCGTIYRMESLKKRPL